MGNFVCGGAVGLLFTGLGITLHTSSHTGRLQGEGRGGEGGEREREGERRKGRNREKIKVNKGR